LRYQKKDLEKARQNFFISKYIRWQALTSNQVTNLNHLTITINEPSRQTLILLDGGLDRQALTKAFYQRIESGALAVLDDKGEPVKLKKGSSEVSDLLNAVLSGLAQQALLQDLTAG
jgi:hypothetical protein